MCYSPGQVASRGGLGGAGLSRAVGRPWRLVLGLPGTRRGSAWRVAVRGSMWRARGHDVLVEVGHGLERVRGVTRRLGRRSCNTRALGASSARTEGVRHNAVACYRSQVRLASNRTRLEIEGNSRDKVVWSGGQVHNVYLRSCQISPCTPGVCQNAKGT